ncbi:MAG: Mut7-C RNAse domain-containing protein [Candidatus Pacebacteria bacterium]|nr:Mut7-C RNAse domain-containing protein [Candidatus Paceibacterota bacterium]
MKDALKPKFLLTENLNRLAKWLRMLGYDAAIYKSISFHNMIRLAKKERRIILTRSNKQAKSNLKFSRILIKADNHLEQIKELKEVITFNEQYTFLRCLLCNKLLYGISREKVKDLVPEFIYENQTDFKVCRKCGKIYWHGTHYKAMLMELRKIL